VPETLDVNALLTGSQAAAYAGVTLATICTWRTRGYLLRGSKIRAWLPVATDSQGREVRDDHGRPKYRLLDVAKAEAATSIRARRAA
jgi:hypothetical protein